MGKEDLQIQTGEKKGRYLHTVFLLFFVFLGFPFLPALLGWEISPWLFQYIFLLFLGGIFFLWERSGSSPEDLTKIFAFPEKEKKSELILYSFCTGFALQGIFLPLHYFTGELLSLCGIPAKEQPMVILFKTLPFSQLILYFLPVLFLAPIVEEWVFRHTLYKEGCREFPPLAASLWQGGLFALVHWNFAAFPGLFLFALFLQWNVRKRGTLWGGILPHFFFNLAAVAGILLGRAFAGNLL